MGVSEQRRSVSVQRGRCLPRGTSGHTSPSPGKQAHPQVGRHLPPHPPDGHCRGWYASYWNVFLLLVVLSHCWLAKVVKQFIGHFLCNFGGSTKQALFKFQGREAGTKLNATSAIFISFSVVFNFTEDFQLHMNGKSIKFNCYFSVGTVHQLSN